MQKIKGFILIFFIFLNQLSFGKEVTPGNVIEINIHLLTQKKELLDKLCFDKNNNFLSVIHEFEGRELNCAKEFNKLKKEFNELDKSIQQSSLNESSPIQLSTETLCQTSLKGLIGNKSIDKLINDSETITDQIKTSQNNSCKNKPDVPILNCFKPTCLYAGLIKTEASILKGLPDKVGETFKRAMLGNIDQKNCELDSALPKCMTELVHGVFKNVWDNISNLWGFIKMSGEWMWGKIAAPEKKSSEAMIAAGSTAPGLIDQFKAAFKLLPDYEKAGNALGKLFTLMGNSLVQMIDTNIREVFGCERWEGAPYISKCLIPMQSWNCSSCTVKIGAVCGTVGYVGGEIVSAFLTGGALNAAHGTLLVCKNSAMAIKLAEVTSKVTASVGKYSLKTLAPLNKVLTVATPKLQKISSVLAPTLGIAVKYAGKIYKLSKQSLNEFNALKTSFAKTTKDLIEAHSVLRITEKMVNSSLRLTGKAYSTTLGAYLKLIDDAFMSGLNINKKIPKLAPIIKEEKEVVNPTLKKETEKKETEKLDEAIPLKITEAQYEHFSEHVYSKDETAIINDITNSVLKNIFKPQEKDDIVHYLNKRYGENNLVKIEENKLATKVSESAKITFNEEKTLESLSESSKWTNNLNLKRKICEEYFVNTLVQFCVDKKSPPNIFILDKSTTPALIKINMQIKEIIKSSTNVKNQQITQNELFTNLSNSLGNDVKSDKFNLKRMGIKSNGEFDKDAEALILINGELEKLAAAKNIGPDSKKHIKTFFEKRTNKNTSVWSKEDQEKFINSEILKCPHSNCSPAPSNWKLVEDKEGRVKYNVEWEGHKIDLFICRNPEGCGVHGHFNDVLTVYPLCGPRAKDIQKLTQLIKSFSENVTNVFNHDGNSSNLIINNPCK